MTAFPLGERHLAITDILALSQPGTRAALSDPTRARISAAHDVVLAWMAADKPVYGLNTGLGANVGHRIPAADIAAHQETIVRGRTVGIGDPLPETTCRAALLCRLADLASGQTGVSPTTTGALLDLFNHDVTPVIASVGSIGASDLGLMAPLALVAIGSGEAWVGGRRMPGGQALALAGLQPVALQPKDGLGVIGHGAVTAARAALVLAELDDLVLLQGAAAALAFEAYGANPGIFDPRLHAAHPAAGQVEAAALMRALLEGSALLEPRGTPGGPRNLQDALSFREIAPMLGSTWAALSDARVEAEIEINGVTTSPMVLIEDGAVLSSPNFHNASLARVLDGLANALAHGAIGSFYRIAKLMTEALSGLPKYLSPVGGASAGFVPLQKTAAALCADIRSRTFPAGLDALPVSDTVEDVAPLTPLAVRKLEDQLPALRHLVAIEALVAAQGVDLRASPRLGAGPALVREAIRRRVPALAADRETGPDVMTVAEVLREPGLLAALRALAGAPDHSAR